MTIKQVGDEWVVYDSTGKKELGRHPSKAKAEAQLRAIESNQIRVNLCAVVNKADIRREERNGRPHLVIPSYTLPAEVVMNGGLYPAEEIDRSYATLEGTLAPMGHPQLDGQFISAREPEAINAYHVGAFNRGVEKRGSRVYVEKWVDVEKAAESEAGRKLLEAVAAGEPIHTSTGVFLRREPVENADGYEWIARDMTFDHDAILLGEIGAATPEQGVGMMVNTTQAKPLQTNLGERVLGADTYGARMDTISEAVRKRFGRPDSWVCVENFDDRRVVYATSEGSFYIDYLILDGMARLEGEPLPVQAETSYYAKNSIVNKFLQWMRNAVFSEPIDNQPPEDQDMTPEELKAALDAQAETLTQALNAAVAPLTERLTAVEQGIEANARAAETDKRAHVAKVLGETVANALTGNALDEAFAKLQTSAPLLPGMPATNADQLADYDKPIA